MPDLPDDHFEIDTSIFENGGLMRGAFIYYQNKKGADGLSHHEREQKQREKQWDIMDRKQEAQLQRDLDSMNMPCTHEPECPGDICKYTIEAREAAEQQYQKTIAEIDAETAPKPKKPEPTNGPSTLISRAAAATLSQPKISTTTSRATSKPEFQTTKPRLNTSLASGAKKAPAPTNPSNMRHTAAVANSKTTMGYAKGRSTSAALRKTVLPEKNRDVPDTSLAPAEYIHRYGVPRLGSEMWFICKRAGCFDEDEGPSLEEIFAGDNPNALDKLIREEAEQDFQLIF